MGFNESDTPLVREINLPAGGSFVITDATGAEIFRVTAAGNEVRVGGLAVDATTAVPGLTATVDELNLLAGAGAVVASGTAATHQADLATNANGTAIAAAVNGLRDDLVAFGMMAAS